MAAARKKTSREVKSIYRRENAVFLETLRALRERADLSQVELAAKLNRSQSFITAVERGTVRADGLQLWDWTHACGSDLVGWAKEIENALAAPAPKRPSSKTKPAPRKKTTKATIGR